MAIPPGLAKWQATHRKGKPVVKKGMAPGETPAQDAKAQAIMAKLGLKAKGK
jgi:hypothetical protein